MTVSDPPPRDAHPPSPCVRVCALDPAGEFCVGCWRSTVEITAWASMDAGEKHDTLARTEVRKAARREQMRELRRRRQRQRSQG